MAMAMGTSAPAPTAWKILAATSQGRSGATATAAEPPMNRSIESTKRRRCPYMSETLPKNGMAAT